MRFVPVKSEEQQAAILLHRVRDLLIRQRTQLVNALRSHLAEFGIVGPQGLWNVKRLVDAVRDGGGLPAAARRALTLLVEQLESLGGQVAAVRRTYGPGTASTRRAAASRRSRGSGLSPPPRSSRRSRTSRR